MENLLSSSMFSYIIQIEVRQIHLYSPYWVVYKEYLHMISKETNQLYKIKTVPSLGKLTCRGWNIPHVRENTSTH